eukprot:15466988-Alexandrium_andersonii.AAC.1
MREMLAEQRVGILAPYLEWLHERATPVYQQASPMTKAASWITTMQWVLRGTRSRGHFGIVLEDVDSLARITATAEARSL